MNEPAWETLQYAADAVHDGRWIKGRASSSDLQSLCLLAWANEAAYTERQNAINYILRALRRLYWWRPTVWFTWPAPVTLIGFNDMPWTTRRQVERVLRRAAAYAKQDRLVTQ